MVLKKVGQYRGGWGRVTVWASQGCGADGGTLVRGCEGSGGERGGGGDAGEPHTRATERSAGGGKKEDGGGGEAQNGGGGSGGDGGGGVNGGARTDGDEIDGGEGQGCMAAAGARTFVVFSHWHSTCSSATCVRGNGRGHVARTGRRRARSSRDRGRVWWRALPAHLPSEELDAAPGRRGRDLGDVGERAHDVVGDARPQPRRGDDDSEEHHGGEERPGAAWARSSFRSGRGAARGFSFIRA